MDAAIDSPEYEDGYAYGRGPEEGPEFSGGKLESCVEFHMGQVYIILGCCKTGELWMHAWLTHFYFQCSFADRRTK